MILIKKLLRQCLPIELRKKIFRLRRALFSKQHTFGNPSYSEDGLHSDHISDFLNDPKFTSAYEFGIKNWRGSDKGQSIRYRAYIASWVARQCLHTNGVFIEFGVGAGVIAGTIVKSLENKNLTLPKFFLFDSFSGIPMEVATTAELSNITRMNKLEYDYEYFELAKEKFSPFENVHLVKGNLPNTLLDFLTNSNSLLSNGISFVSMDLNNAFSEIKCIELIWDRISKNGIILLDDYAYDEDFRAQKEAWDYFAKERNFEVLTLPTGQGLIIKP